MAATLPKIMLGEANHLQETNFLQETNLLQETKSLARKRTYKELMMLNGVEMFVLDIWLIQHFHYAQKVASKKALNGHSWIFTARMLFFFQINMTIC